MSLGFDNINDSASSNGGYLRTPGIQMEATFKALTYVFSEAWEGFDIEIETRDGKKFRERTFGANINKVFPKQKYSEGQAVGMETMQEAYDRVNSEINTKLFHLAACFVGRDELKSSVKNVRDLKDLIDKINKSLGGADTTQKVNFLTMWKNSETKRKSNLIIADKVKWVEPTTYGPNNEAQPARISLSKYQITNNMVEKFPYQGGTPTGQEIVLNGSVTDDLPF